MRLLKKPPIVSPDSLKSISEISVKWVKGECSKKIFLIPCMLKQESLHLTLTLTPSRISLQLKLIRHFFNGQLLQWENFLNFFSNILHAETNFEFCRAGHFVHLSIWHSFKSNANLSSQDKYYVSYINKSRIEWKTLKILAWQSLEDTCLERQRFLLPFSKIQTHNWRDHIVPTKNYDPSDLKIW